ncbi:hypothetical protein V6N11_050556 [Hibiscus sabdariffa]|uniref:Uncharacterized protein n=1 Tax=Hibiscus sabdariffa TaxID=183260 RepID=A0ABR2TB14_9ROSI
MVGKEILKRAIVPSTKDSQRVGCCRSQPGIYSSRRIHFGWSVQGRVTGMSPAASVEQNLCIFDTPSKLCLASNMGEA